jgi:hypothetical protein
MGFSHLPLPEKFNPSPDSQPSVRHSGLELETLSEMLQANVIGPLPAGIVL